jgi:hypothetical protein
MRSSFGSMSSIRSGSTNTMRVPTSFSTTTGSRPIPSESE